MVAVLKEISTLNHVETKYGLSILHGDRSGVSGSVQYFRLLFYRVI
jgi:hypothetical protein